MKLPAPSKMTGFISVIYYLSFAVISGPDYNSIRSMGMGNVSVVTATDRTAIFHNPAGLSALKNVIDFSISPIFLSTDGKFITLIKKLEDHKRKLTDISKIDRDFIEMCNEMDGQWVGFQYLPEISIATDNLGFGIYSTLPVNARVESGHFIPKLALRGERNIVFTWAVSTPLKHSSNHCGISVEYIQRTPLKETITTYSETFVYFEKIASSKALRLLGDLSETKHGVSFDISFRHDFKKFQGFKLAYSVKDVLGIIGGQIVFPPDLTIGCAYYFPQMNKVRLIDNLILAMEVSDIFGLEFESEKYEHFVKKLHAGVELDLHYGIFRIGINQGYFTTGLGIRYGMFFMDYAFFTEEWGYYPGQLPYKKHILSVGASLGFKRRSQKNKTGRQDSDSSSSMDLESEDKSPLKTLKAGPKAADNNQNVLQNITVEKAPVQNESLINDGNEEMQNAIEIGDTEVESPEVGRDIIIEEDLVERDKAAGNEAEDTQGVNDKTIETTTEEKIGWE